MITRHQNVSDIELYGGHGSEYVIYQAAVMTYNRTDFDESVDEDEIKRIIKLLLDKGHHVPFEHTLLTYRINAPLFVLRQLYTYRIRSCSEVSLRRTEPNFEYYIPEGIDEELEQEFELQYMESESTYNKLIQSGVSKEQARIVLPSAMFSSVLMSLNLRSLFHIMEQRLRSSTQSETRFVVNEMAKQASSYFPTAVNHFAAINNIEIQ